MNPSQLAIASDFVKTGMEKAGVPLTENLEAYLSITFARFMGETIRVDLLTVRITEAMDARASRDMIRALADECLIACAFFEATQLAGFGHVEARKLFGVPKGVSPLTLKIETTAVAQTAYLDRFAVLIAEIGAASP